MRSGWSIRSSAGESFVKTACFQDSIAESTSAFGSAAASDTAAANRRKHLRIGFQLTTLESEWAGIEILLTDSTEIESSDEEAFPL